MEKNEINVFLIKKSNPFFPSLCIKGMFFVLLSINCIINLI